MFLLKKLIAGNFPHSSLPVLSLNIFQDPFFFLVTVLAAKTIGCFFLVQLEAANIKKQNSFAFSEVVGD